MKQLALLVLVIAQAATRPNVIEAQIPGRAVDGAAVEFRRIAESRHVLTDEVRMPWLQAVFDTATAGYRRDQPMDTVIDAAGEVAIYRRLRPEWNQGDVARWESALAALQSIDRARLGDDDALNHDIMLNVVRRQLALAAPPYFYMPLTNQRGPHFGVWFYGSEWLPSETLADYRMVLAHLNGIALEIDGMIEGMRQARAEGILPPQSLVTNVPDDLTGMIVDDPMASGYLVKFTEFPASILPSEQPVLRANAARIYATKIRPAYERLLTYATDVHLPDAIPDTSFAALPGRAERYALILRLRTAPEGLSPAQVHQKALDDVARSTAAIDSIRVAIVPYGPH